MTVTMLSDAKLMRYVREVARTSLRLPGEFELMERLGCSRQQLRNGLARLEQAGIIRKRQGAPTTIAPIALKMSVRLEDQFEHSELLSRLGYEPRMEMLSAVAEPLPEHVANQAGIPAAAPSLHTLKRWSADGRPVMIAEGYLMTPDLDERKVNDSVFLAATEVWGEAPVWEVATPSAVAAGPAVAEMLAVEEGAALLTLEIIGISASGRRLFYAFEHHLPEVVQYSFSRTVRPPWSSA